MSRFKGLWRSALVMTLSVTLIFILFIIGLIGFMVLSFTLNTEANFSTNGVDEALVKTETGYQFTTPELLDGKGQWAMLIDDQSGQIIWSYNKPDDIPSTYTMRDVASFTRWYLEDYPVRTRIRDDGLLIIGAPKFSSQRYTLEIPTNTIGPTFFWFSGLFIVMIASVLAVSALLLRRWFRKDQSRVDAARAEWVNGVSHDIRTPLSLVMGSAAQLETDPTLSADARSKATLIRRQSQTIRDLVGDLNLTMRLESSMQVLRHDTVQPAALLRQTVADFLNSGQADAYPLDMALPDTPLPPLDADAALLRRALTNLLSNCVRHNPPGSRICVGGFVQDKHCVLFIESDAPASAASIGKSPGVGEDGLAAHGTGLSLVIRIAKAHGGEARFDTEGHFRCELWLPLP